MARRDLNEDLNTQARLNNGQADAKLVMSETKHKCAVPDCEAQVSLDMLMCKPHWFQVPRAIRNRIWAAYRNRNLQAHKEAVGEALKAFRPPEERKVTAKPKRLGKAGRR